MQLNCSSLLRGVFGQQHIADYYIDGRCTLFLTAWRMMLSCWHSAAVLCLRCFPHINPLVWVISARKCPMMTAKAFFFPTLFLLLVPHIPAPGQPPHKPSSQAADRQPRSLSGCPKHRASAWMLSQWLSYCGLFGYWCCWPNLMSPLMLPHPLFTLQLQRRLSECWTEAAGTKAPSE